MHKKLDNEFLKKKILIKNVFDDVKFDLIDISKAFRILTNDLKSKRKFFFKSAQ